MALSDRPHPRSLAGSVWALHTFYLVSTALMLVWYLRYETPSNAQQGQAESDTEPTLSVV
jgi:hypothetical protein